MPELNWRTMTACDLDAVAEIARVGFPDHFEGRGCFQNRLALNPAGCFVLSDPAGAVGGFLIAYPWRREEIPALDTLIEALPQDADVLYLHDLAITPSKRGGGLSRPIVERLAGQARADGWPALTLVAVNDAVAFWQGHGFVVHDSPALRARLAGYGADARYMVRRLD
jgi:GNAT superfamily N-acetyltransferase